MQRPYFLRQGAVALLLAGFALNTPAATVTALPSTPATIITSGFESPAVAGEPGGYVYKPTGTNWTFEGRTGIAAVGGNFNVPSPPQGSQVGILQRPLPGSGTVSSMSRSFTIAAAGRYRLSLQSAQRQFGQTLNQQIASVRIDSTEIGQFKPAGATFEPVVFDALTLASGNHELSFTALVIAGDNTLFIDDVRIDSIAGEARAWSNPATWDTGTAPTAADDVVIPAGSSVLMDGVLLAKSISVSGNLYCADSNITLETQWLAVMGRLVCGSPGSRYTNNFILTLKGTDDDGDIMGMGDKFLGAMGRGAIELHGEQRTSFVQLRDTADIGSSVIALSGLVGWRTGDELVVAPTRWTTNAQGQPVNEAEVVTVHSITTAGPLHDRYSVVQLKNALTQRHYGKTTTYNKPDNSYSWTLDERAEVGLLTRNIRIQGDEASATDGFGGHMMSMRGSSVHANGIELRRMGQKAKLARYPFHWHLARDVPGQYIQNSSIHESYNRCVVVHGSHRARVADNVCYNFIGHGYFLENGNEKKNTFDHNLAVWGRRPLNPPATPNPPDELPLETDYREGAASNGPAAFWISHPDNVFTNNVAAGIEGAAFWYHLEETVFVPEAEPGCDAPPLEPGCRKPEPDPDPPANSPFGTFDNNRGYASRQGFSSCIAGGGTGGMNTVGAVVSRLTTTQVGQGIWPCGRSFTRFDQTIVANTENGMQAPLPMAFSNSLFVAYTANAPANAGPAGRVPWVAVWIYDQGFDFDNVHFENYDRPAMSVFQRAGGAHKAASNRSKRLSFRNSPHVFRDHYRTWWRGSPPAGWGEVIHDLDGSLLTKAPGSPPLAFVSSHPLMSDASCWRPVSRITDGLDTGLDGYGCPYRYGTLLLHELAPTSELAPLTTIVRSDGVHDTGYHGQILGRSLNNHIVNSSYRYAYRYVEGPQVNLYAMYFLWNLPNSSSVHEIMDMPATALVIPDKPAVAWQRVFQLQDLVDANVNSYFYRSESSSLFFKAVATQEFLPNLGLEWNASTSAQICLDDCVARTRSVERPKVQIAAPLDRARVAATPLGVTATLSDSLGLACATLYIGDNKGSTVNLSNDPSLDCKSYPATGQTPVGGPASASVTLSSQVIAPGSYPLKVIAKNTRGHTYTAVQQVHIGKAAPYVEFSSGPVDGGSYFAGTAPDIVIGDFSPNDGVIRHLHWFIDGVDQGHVPASQQIGLGSLSQGTHRIEAGYADSSHNMLAIRDSVIVHIVSNGWIADFEDGVDLRNDLVYNVTGGTQRFFLESAWTFPYLSRVEPQNDDVNYFDALRFVPPGASAPDPIVTHSMDLRPGMNWDGFNAVQIYHYGPHFELLVKYADLAQPQLATVQGLVSHNQWGNSTYTLPNRPGKTVTGLVMRYRPPLTNSCTPAWCRQILASVRLLSLP